MSNGNMTVVVQPKSAGISVILTFLFGPIGLFYASIVGGIVMTVVTLIVAVITLGLGVIIPWAISIIWGVMSVQAYNESLQGNQSGQGSTHDAVQTQTPGTHQSQTAINTSGTLDSHASDPDEYYKEIVRGYEKNCPMCDETIKLFAKKCKHCGTEFSEEEVAQEIDWEIQKLKKSEEYKVREKATTGEKENKMLLKGFESDIQRMFPGYEDIVLSPFKFYIVVKAKDRYNLLDISGFKPKKIIREVLERDDFKNLRSWMGEALAKVPSKSG